MSCCDYECNQGRDCPVRQTAYPRHCETSKQPCVQPYTCGQRCVIDIAKLTQCSGGQRVDCGLPVEMFELPSRWYLRPPSLWVFATVGAVIGFVYGICQNYY